MPLSTSIAVGDRVAYIGRGGPGLPESGEVGEIQSFAFPAGKPTEYVVVFPQGVSVQLAFDQWTPAADYQKNQTLGRLLIGGLVAAGLGWWLYRRFA